jgi:micrococcal nuclease
LALIIAIGVILLARVFNTWGDADGRYPVISVVDGDTIKVRMSGATESVRLIGIDAPEAQAPDRQAQCFATEASAIATELLDGKVVRLEFDASQGRRDRYERLLAYVWIEDENFNEWMIRNGYAREFTYNTTYRHQETFKAAEAEARAAQRGLWAATTCNGRL